jgi:hypothetical protein
LILRHAEGKPCMEYSPGEPILARCARDPSLRLKSGCARDDASTDVTYFVTAHAKPSGCFPAEM